MNHWYINSSRQFRLKEGLKIRSSAKGKMQSYRFPLKMMEMLMQRILMQYLIFLEKVSWGLTAKKRKWNRTQLKLIFHPWRRGNYLRKNYFSGLKIAGSMSSVLWLCFTAIWMQKMSLWFQMIKQETIQNPLLLYCMRYLILMTRRVRYP